MRLTVKEDILQCDGQGRLLRENAIGWCQSHCREPLNKAQWHGHIAPGQQHHEKAQEPKVALLGGCTDGIRLQVAQTGGHGSLP